MGIVLIVIAALVNVAEEGVMLPTLHHHRILLTLLVAAPLQILAALLQLLPAPNVV